MTRSSNPCPLDLNKSKYPKNRKATPGENSNSGRRFTNAQIPRKNKSHPKEYTSLGQVWRLITNISAPFLSSRGAKRRRTLSRLGLGGFLAQQRALRRGTTQFRN